MIDVIVISLTIILASIGVFFFTVGTIGLLRFPDVYTRLHPATKCDTLGMGSILLALAIYEGFSIDAIKLLIIAFIIMIESPTAGHAIARAAYKMGIKPWQVAHPEEGATSDLKT